MEGHECETHIIRKTCTCNVYPLKPHFYIAKLGFAGVNLFFLFLLQNIDCGYSLEPPRRGGSNVYPQSMFLSKNKKNIKHFLLENFYFFYGYKNLCILHGRVFVMLKAETKKVQVGKDQEKAQSEKDSHSKNRGGKKPN